MTYLQFGLLGHVLLNKVNINTVKYRRVLSVITRTIISPTHQHDRYQTCPFDPQPLSPHPRTPNLTCSPGDVHKNNDTMNCWTHAGPVLDPSGTWAGPLGPEKQCSHAPKQLSSHVNNRERKSYTCTHSAMSYIKIILHLGRVLIKNAWLITNVNFWVNFTLLRHMHDCKSYACMNNKC